MLKKIKTWFYRGKQDDKGIAILFTLGILSLLLIMAMSFATDSIIERKVAYNNNTRTQAKLLSQSALNRAVAAMKYYTEDPSGLFPHSYGFSGIYSSGTDSDNISNLFALSGDSSKESFSQDAINNTRWQYIKDGDGTGKIIGRFAFAAMADSGRIDIAAAVDSGISAALVENMTSKTRPGVDVNELYVGAANTDLTVGNELTAISCTTSGGALPLGERWVANEQILSIFYRAGLAWADTNKRAKFNHLFSVYNPPDIEAYWVDGNSNNKKEMNSTTYEMYHRFNLARTDWDTVNWNPTGATGPAAVARLRSTTTNPEKFNATFTGDSGIQYLNQICSDKKTFATLDDRRNQVAANIIDYCDGNSIPTSDVPPSSWTTIAPRYTGNEKTFYINEVAVKVGVNVSFLLDAGGPGIDRYTVSPYYLVGGEVINIYDNTTPGSYSLQVVGSCTYTFSSGANTTSNTFAIDDTVTGLGTSSLHFAAASDKTPTPSNSWTIDLPHNSVVDATLQVTITKAILTESTYGNVDYAGINLVGAAKTSATAIGAAYYYNYAVEAKDPRQNLNSGDWDTTTATTGAAVGTEGTSNTNANPSTGADKEITTQANYTSAALSGHISTAYMRNAPMQSPWELGLIHRGALWETINLKKFNSAINYAMSASGAGSYTDGDAGILDQVKFNELTRVYGKVDINLQENDILKALFYNLPILDDNISGYANPGSVSTNKLLNTDYAALYAELTKSFSAGNLILQTGYGNRYKHRAEIANPLNTLIAADATMSTKTDAQKECLIGKIINLTKAAEPPNEIRVMVIAQTIRDIAGNITKTQTNGSGIVSRTCTLGTFDVDTSTTPYTYFDEITGEQKLFAIVARDPATNKFTIKRLEFINE